MLYIRNAFSALMLHALSAPMLHTFSAPMLHTSIQVEGLLAAHVWHVSKICK